MSDRQRQWPSRDDVRSGRTLRFNSEAEQEEPTTRRISGPAVAKQRIILLARDMRSRLSSSAIARVLGEQTLRGMSDINETLERLSAPKEGTGSKARVIDYGGVDPFKAEVARALGRTEVCEAANVINSPPPQALHAFSEITDAEAAPADAVSPFAETSRFSPPPELAELLGLHEDTKRSLNDSEPEPEPEATYDDESEQPKRSNAKLLIGVMAVLAVCVAGNWPLATEPVHATLSGYSGVRELTAQVAGKVAVVLVAAGDHVTAGQPVLQLEAAAEPDLPAAAPADHDPEVKKLQQALQTSSARADAQRSALSTQEAKRDQLMHAAVQTREYVSPTKLSALDDQVDAARSQLRALEVDQLRAQQALDAKQKSLAPTGPQQPREGAPPTVNAGHAGLVVRVRARPGATIAPATPLLSVLGDAAVPALLITCSEPEAQLLLESPEVKLTAQDQRFTAIVTRLVEAGPGASSAGEEQRTVELALNDAAQLAELVKRAEVGMSIVFELPEPRTLFSQASRWLQQEFQ